MEFEISTNQKEEVVDISEKIREFVKGRSGKAVLVYCPHTTAGILINENYDPDVQKDILKFFKDSVPETGWKHGEGNSPAHIKSSLIGVSKVIPIVDEKLGLGRWQGIGFAEFDGPRKRKVVVEMI